jgi:hypothetical protein
MDGGDEECGSQQSPGENSGTIHVGPPEKDVERSSSGLRFLASGRAAFVARPI